MDEQTKKVLHQQLELLAERSKTCADDNLADITQAMCTIAKEIKPKETVRFIPEGYLDE